MKKPLAPNVFNVTFLDMNHQQNQLTCLQWNIAIQNLVAKGLPPHEIVEQETTCPAPPNTGWMNQITKFFKLVSQIILPNVTNPVIIWDRNKGDVSGQLDTSAEMEKHVSLTVTSLPVQKTQKDMRTPDRFNQWDEQLTRKFDKERKICINQKDNNQQPACVIKMS